MVIASYVGSNTYSISTNSHMCYQKILDDSPWHFIGKLFNVKEWNPKLKLSLNEVDMEIAAFWVYVHNLPPKYMSAKNAPIISSQLS